MASHSIYQNNSQKSFVSGFGQGYVIGVLDAYKSIAIEQTAPPVSENNYLLLANKIQHRIDTIMENYELYNKEAVALFLNDNTSSIAFIGETFSKVYEFIPETKKIVLDVLINPEDHKKSLIAKIYPDLSFDEAIDRLDVFDREWFASKFIESEMNFNITLDFE